MAVSRKNKKPSIQTEESYKPQDNVSNNKKTYFWEKDSFWVGLITALFTIIGSIAYYSFTLGSLKENYEIRIDRIEKELSVYKEKHDLLAKQLQSNVTDIKVFEVRISQCENSSKNNFK